MTDSLHSPVILDIAGTTLTADDRRRLAHPLTGGMILFARHFESRAQLTALCAEAKSLRPELVLGELLTLELSRPGKEDGQAVGYLDDGSMVVVVDGRNHLGRRVEVEVTSVLPTSGGKMVFARLTGGEA